MKMLINKYLKIFIALWFLSVTQTVQAEYLIGPDDVVQIKVYGYDDLAISTRVADNGRIVFPYLGEIEVAEKTEYEVAHTIAKLLAQRGFISDANVSATVFEYKSKQISMLGYIKAPGIYTLKSRNALVDVIAMAGGIGEMGDYRAIVTRQENGKQTKHEIDLRTAFEHPERSEPFFIKKGDVIYIPKAPMFYIHGEVQHSGSYRVEPNMTVDQAISLGGGLTPRGTLNGIMIKRIDANGVSQEIEVELSDKILENDVIMIDERLF